jgi:hypothetical protein
MIHEFRTYTLKPGTVPQAEQAFADKIAERVKLSPLAGFWRSEVGTLNQIIHIWSYKDTNERAKIRAEAVEKKLWPPAIADFVVNMDVKIMIGAPFSPNFKPGEYGNIYEFRTYTYAAGMVPKVQAVWEKHIQARIALSPLIFAGYPDIGGTLNQWTHVWAYKNMGERERIRGEAVAKGIWPPPRDPSIVMLRQETSLCIPAKFSPAR